MDETNAVAPDANPIPSPGPRDCGVETYVRDEPTLKRAAELAQRAHDLT